jgi:hypothetical protein
MPMVAEENVDSSAGEGGNQHVVEYFVSQLGDQAKQPRHMLFLWCRH